MSKTIRKKLKRLRSLKIRSASPLFKKIRIRKVKPKRLVKKKSKKKMA
jgi:hypothetical protein